MRPMRHILLTNDDGVDSPGLAALAAALDPIGRLSVIAPDRNRSGIGRGITINGPLHVEDAFLVDGRPALATDGTPVDCVRFAALGLFGEPPDVVVSGVNLGMNLGDDVTYSGTVAAALEGVLLGVPSIAASQAPVARTESGPVWDFRASADFVARLVPMASDIDFPRHVVLSVNVPGLPPEEVRAARLTRLGRRIYDDELILEAEQNGRRRYSIYGVNPSHHREDGTDFAAVEAGELSVTPIHFDLTDIAEMSRLERLQLNDLLGAQAAPADR